MAGRAEDADDTDAASGAEDADWGSAGRAEGVANTNAVSGVKDADCPAQVGQRTWKED